MYVSNFNFCISVDFERRKSCFFFFRKLISVLKSLIDNANSSDQTVGDILLKTMKSLQYCIKFIVTSRQLYSK